MAMRSNIFEFVCTVIGVCTSCMSESFLYSQSNVISRCSFLVRSPIALRLRGAGSTFTYDEERERNMKLNFKEQVSTRDCW